MKTFLKALKASNFKERNQTKTDIQDFRNIKTFETFQRYVSLLFPVFSNFWVLLYYYFDLQKLEFAGHIHTYIYVYVIYIYILYILYIYYICIIYIIYIIHYILYICLLIFLDPPSYSSFAFVLFAVPCPHSVSFWKSLFFVSLIWCGVSISHMN